MASTPENRVGDVPEGFAAIPITGDGTDGSLRICAVVKVEADPVAGHLVVVRDLVDARVYLGCVGDAGGAVQAWVEIWVQDLDQLAGAPATCREPLSNAVLDERWMSYFEALRGLDRSSVVETGRESVHPRPVFLDLEKLAPVHPAEKGSGRPLELCTDDALLASKELPPYSTSLHRYLFAPELGEHSPFVPLTSDAPTNEFTQPLEATTAIDREVALNRGGGLLLVRRFSPIGFEDWIDILNGRSWGGSGHGRSPLVLTESARRIAESQDGGALTEGRLFLGRHGKWGRFVESFHLKLALLTAAAETLQSFVRTTQRPLLNLRPASFQIDLGLPGGRLPFLWSARTLLADPGDAMVLPIETTDENYYLIGRSRGSSVYRPESAQEPVRSEGTVRIRKVLDDSKALTVIEGTLSTQEKFRSSPSDLLWLRLNVGGERVNLYAHLETGASITAGEWRFRTLGQEVSKEVRAALEAAEGVPIRDTSFEFLPLLTTPCDLYSFGVLAVRALLVNSRKTLAVAMDEVLSLARKVADRHDPGVKLAQRVGAIFEEDPKWADLLGPQFLSEDSLGAEEAFDLVTPGMWWDTLAMLVRTFPGVGPDSTCRDLGNAPSGSLHKVFDTVIADLNRLLLHTRSLVVIDWRFNREIHSVIRTLLSSRETLKEKQPVEK